MNGEASRAKPGYDEIHSNGGESPVIHCVLPKLRKAKASLRERNG